MKCGTERVSIFLSRSLMYRGTGETRGRVKEGAGPGRGAGVCQGAETVSFLASVGFFPTKLALAIKS